MESESLAPGLEKLDAQQFQLWARFLEHMATEWQKMSKQPPRGLGVGG